MDTTETITNEEVIETTDGIVSAGSAKGLKVAVGIGLTVLIGGILYKYMAKPMIAKIKAKKEQATIIEVEADAVEDGEKESEDN